MEDQSGCSFLQNDVWEANVKISSSFPLYNFLWYNNSRKFILSEFKTPYFIVFLISRTVQKYDAIFVLNFLVYTQCFPLWKLWDSFPFLLPWNFMMVLCTHVHLMCKVHVLHSVWWAVNLEVTKVFNFFFDYFFLWFLSCLWNFQLKRGPPRLSIHFLLFGKQN